MCVYIVIVLYLQQFYDGEVTDGVVVVLTCVVLKSCYTVTQCVHGVAVWSLLNEGAMETQQSLYLFTFYSMFLVSEIHVCQVRRAPGSHYILCIYIYITLCSH